ncbi:MAG: endopeptidase La [Clostridiales bacterium]|nr:endopeptidase La [Clostridiales bacterium]
MNNDIIVLAVVPMRGMVVFPGMTLNFDAGRDASVKALEAAAQAQTEVFLTAQRSADVDEPEAADLYNIGTIAKIRQVMRIPGNAIRVVVEGVRRGVMREIVEKTPYFQAVVETVYSQYDIDHNTEAAYLRMLKRNYEEYFAQAPKLAAEGFMSVMSAKSLDRLCDIISAGVDFDPEKKQELLEEFDIIRRCEKLLSALSEQTQIARLEQQIAKKVKTNIDRNQKEYYLREQLKVIHEELGDGDDIDDESEEYRKKIEKLKAPKDTKEKLLKEVSRFAKMPPSAAESGVLRNYLDTVLELPWNNMTKEGFDVEKTRQILDEDHYGLDKIKERILEYLVVRQLTKGKSGTILCLVGPPGVGKTSVAKSVARALGRKYVRVSLGGIHDESDIRGHRKTYIGAMEGRIMAAMREAKTKNPMILLDEIDKMGADYKGDPSAALLEVLDYEQNNAFRDHYVEVPFDLSQTLFITTANTLDTISAPLLDRMEVIELSGYTREEKFHIAKDYLIKKAADKNGLDCKKFKVNDDAVYELIDYYTREAGVRKLEQQLDALARKSARLIMEEDKKSVRITKKFIAENLGKRKYHFDMMNKKSDVGIVRGLAWTSVGGETLSVEVNVMDGTGKLELTGKLGDVMKESARTAVSYIRSKSAQLGIDEDFYKTKDIHIHVPEGAVPKDGPSAGITMATALVSALSNKPVRNDIAMTGEITLRGRVLPIGGLKEKSLAAYRAGIKTIIIPEENKPDIDDIPSEVREQIHFIPTASMDQVLKNALS